MLTCQELVALVTDYLEGKLPMTERLRFQLHIGLCGHCRAYLQQMELTVEVLGKLPATPQELPSTTRDAMLAKFRSWKEQPK